MIGRDRHHAYDPEWRSFLITCLQAIVYLSLGAVLGCVWIPTAAWAGFMAVQAIGLTALLIVQFRELRWRRAALRGTDVAASPLIPGVQGPVVKVWLETIRTRYLTYDQTRHAPGKNNESKI
jgi:hypothetical protein